MREERDADNGIRLRLSRQARGYSQQQLADMAGVSRQAIAAVEAGVTDPSLRVALALARILDVTIEEMFGRSRLVRTVPARPVAPLRSEGARVTLALVGDGLVALPLSGAAVSRAGFLPAGGVAAGNSRGSGGTGPIQIRPASPPRPTLVVAGCDPALPLLEGPLSLLDPPVAFSWWPCPSEKALELSAAGLVHVAGAHLRGPDGSYNTTAARNLLPGSAIIGFCSWKEGLAVRPGLHGRIKSIGDVARLGLRLVNREPGSEARSLLDRELSNLGIDPASVPGYHTHAAGHLQVAEAIAAGLADAGIASEPAARAYGLDFISLASEHFDLVIPEAQTATREVQSLLRILSSRWLFDQLTSLPGYDPTRCGQRIATPASLLT
jgi:putative molybdopterin biosynthesis protein